MALKLFKVTKQDKPIIWGKVRALSYNFEDNEYVICIGLYMEQDFKSIDPKTKEEKTDRKIILVRVINIRPKDPNFDVGEIDEKYVMEVQKNG